MRPLSSRRVPSSTPAVVFIALVTAACGSSDARRQPTRVEDAGDSGRSTPGTGGRAGSGGGASAGGATGSGGSASGGGGTGGADASASTGGSVPDASVVPDASADGATPSTDGAAAFDGALPTGCVGILGNTSLVAHWTGDNTFDEATDAHNGNVVGSVTFVAGVVGQAFHFDGNAFDYVDIAPSEAFDLQRYTIAGWVRTPAGQNAWATVVTKENQAIGDPWDSRNYGLFVGNSAGGCNLGGAALLATSSGICSTKIVNDGAWHHLAGTSDGCTLSLYVDGTFIQSAPAGAINTGPNQTVRLGAWNVTGTEDLDEVLVYSGAMSATDIAALASPPPSVADPS